MTLRVDFGRPIDGGGGRIDALRVVASSGFVADDMDTRVRFSSFWPAARIEKFAPSISISNATNQVVTGTINLTRSYATWPILLACYRTNSGAYIFPYYRCWTRYHISNGGSIDQINILLRNSLILTLNALGNNAYSVDYYIENYAGATSSERPFSDGVLYLYAAGKAA